MKISLPQRRVYKPSRAQLEWIRRLSVQGYKCVVIWDSVEDVMAAIDEYLGESL